MPKLWTETIASHRREVRDAILSATGTLVEQHGLHALTMSQVAEQAGIGRATLYKYFPDLDTVLAAWHGRQIAEHLTELTRIRDQADPDDRLRAVLEAYAARSREHRGGELATRLHGGEHAQHARRELQRLVRDLVVAGAMAGDVRDDIAPDELAGFCLHALARAADLASGAAVRRLVTLTIDAIRPPA